MTTAVNKASGNTRRTDWVVCTNGPWYPTMDHGGFSAYRIWKEFDGRGWFQRHEWKHGDGSTEMDDWIPTFAGFDGFDIVEHP